MFLIKVYNSQLEKEVKRAGCGRPAILVHYMDSAACRPSAARCTDDGDGGAASSSAPQRVP